MKKRQNVFLLLIITLGFIFCYPLSALSQVTLTAGEGAGSPGSSGNEVAISLENLENLVLGVQLDICDVGDHLVITGIETTSRTEGFDCDFNELENGCARILIFSMSLETIEKGSGPVLVIKYEVKPDAPLKERLALNLENVVIADVNNQYLEVTATTPGEFFIANCIVNIQPSSKTVNSGNTIQFSASNTGDCIEEVPVYQWEVESEIGSEINQYGLYTAGENNGDPVTDNVTVTDTANHISATAYITVGTITGCQISIQPSSQSISSGETIQFTATNAGDCNEDPVYEWNVESEIGSAIDGAGFYTAGYNYTDSPVADIISVTDTANGVSATANIVVTAITGCRITIDPPEATVNPGHTIQFSATATGDCLEPDYVWEVESEIGSEINDNGLYTAGYNNTAAPVTDLVTVYDLANNVSDSAEITVMLPSVRGSIKRISPEWILGSKWAPTQHFISITGKDTYFDNTSRLSFNPGYDIVHIANFSVEPNKIIAIILLNTDPEAGYVDVTVTTGIEEPYTVTGDGMLRIY